MSNFSKKITVLRWISSNHSKEINLNVGNWPITDRNVFCRDITLWQHLILKHCNAFNRKVVVFYSDSQGPPTNKSVITGSEDNDETGGTSTPVMSTWLSSSHSTSSISSEAIIAISSRCLRAATRIGLTFGMSFIFMRWCRAVLWAASMTCDGKYKLYKLHVLLSTIVLTVGQNLSYGQSLLSVWQIQNFLTIRILSYGQSE